MEIEKKYLVKTLPDDLESYDTWELEQCYLCTNPAIRVRRKNGDYILTYKNRSIKTENSDDDSLCISQEVEVPLTSEAYLHLKEKADGKCITKTRYRIPYEKYTIELDIFHDDYDGLLLAEVEFETLEEGRNFQPPEWFGKDVSDDIHYTNSYLSAH